ncbi:MAG: hypothetical protein PVTTEEND_001772 [Candidatus Fervidibacter sp.]
MTNVQWVADGFAIGNEADSLLRSGRQFWDVGRPIADGQALFAESFLALLGRLQTLQSQWLALLLGQLPSGTSVPPFFAHFALALTKTMPFSDLPTLPLAELPTCQTADPLVSPSAKLPNCQPADPSPIVPQPSSLDIQRLVIQTAQRYGVDPTLALAVAKAESDFNPLARSPKGAMGVMQLMPETAKSLGVTDPFNPAQNIEGGIRYLRQLLERFNGQVTLAVAAYNAGPTAVARYGGVPPYPETQTFLRRVLAYWQTFREQLGQWASGQVGNEQISSRRIGKWADGQWLDGQVGNRVGERTSSPPHPSSTIPRPESEVPEGGSKPTVGRTLKEAPNEASTFKANPPSLHPSLLSKPSEPSISPSADLPTRQPAETSSSILRPSPLSVSPFAPTSSPIHRLVAEVPTADGEKAARVLIQMTGGKGQGTGEGGGNRTMPSVSVVVQVAEREVMNSLQAIAPTLRQQLWEQGIALAQFAVYADDAKRERRDPADFAASWQRLPSVAPSPSPQALDEEGVWA